MSNCVRDVLDCASGQETVSRSAPCRHCSFDLCGLPRSGRCPECGAPIAASLCGGYLRSADPHWLNTVASGITMVLWGMLIAFVLAPVAAFAFANEPAVKQILITLGLAVGLCGTWLMTRAQPGDAGETANQSARRFVRAAAIAGLAGAVVQLIVTQTNAPVGQHAAPAIIAIVCGLATVVGEFAKLRYLQVLGARVPDQRLVWRAGSLKWALVVVHGLLVVSGAIAGAATSSLNFAGGLHSDNIASAFGVAAALAWAVPGGLTVLVVTFMIIDLLYRTSRAIRAQMPRVAVAVEADEVFTSPLPRAWPGRAAERAPVAPLRVAQFAGALAAA